MGKKQSPTTLDSAIAKAALKKIASESPKQFVAELNEQGITSLEDLAKMVITSARDSYKAGNYMQFEEGICYKHTKPGPPIKDKILKDIVGQINKKVFR